MSSKDSCRNLHFQKRRYLGFLVHALTASGACIALLSFWAIYQHHWLSALWLMGIAIVIDAIDGFFARMIGVKEVVPEIDGALLDNIVDFVNYTMVPAFFLVVSNLLPPFWRMPCVMAIIFSSAYQFTQIDAKTADHFFKGFPSYWNIAVFYLFFWQTNPWINMSILLFLALLSFVPIKYVYPSQVDYLSKNRWLGTGMVILTITWGISTAWLLFCYPKTNYLCLSISIGYMILYFAISLYRTLVPLASIRRKHGFRLPRNKTHVSMIQQKSVNQL